MKNSKTMKMLVMKGHCHATKGFRRHNPKMYDSVSRGRMKWNMLLSGYMSRTTSVPQRKLGEFKLIHSKVGAAVRYALRKGRI